MVTKKKRDIRAMDRSMKETTEENAGAAVVKMTTVTIRVPVGPPNPGGYLPRKVETRLDQMSEQPLVLRRILDGMQGSHEQLNGGKHVDTYAEAVRRLLELVGHQLKQS